MRRNATSTSKCTLGVYDLFGPVRKLQAGTSGKCFKSLMVELPDVQHAK